MLAEVKYKSKLIGSVISSAISETVAITFSLQRYFNSNPQTSKSKKSATMRFKSDRGRVRVNLNLRSLTLLLATLHLMVTTIHSIRRYQLKQIIWRNSLKDYSQYDQIAMSMHSVQLKRFICEVHRDRKMLPKNQLVTYCDRNCPTVEGIKCIFDDMHGKNCLTTNNFKQLVILLYLGIIRQSNMLLESALTFLRELMAGRMLMLCFQEGEMQIYSHLCYIDELLSLMVPAVLQNNLAAKLLDIITYANNSGNIHRQDSISLLVEAMLIEKIKAHLTQDSLTEFNSIIGDIISQAKMECLKDIENSNCLNLDYIALLRNHDDKYELSKLEYTGTTLSATKNTTTILPQWVIEPFIKLPRNLSLKTLQQNREVFEVFTFLMQLQIFTSSPLVEDVLFYVPEGPILDLFTKFLSGEQLSQKPYIFGWQKVYDILIKVKAFSQQVNPCYSYQLGRQMSRIF